MTKEKNAALLNESSNPLKMAQTIVFDSSVLKKTELFRWKNVDISGESNC